MYSQSNTPSFILNEEASSFFNDHADINLGLNQGVYQILGSKIMLHDMLHEIFFHAKLIKIAACSSHKFQAVFKYKKASLHQYRILKINCRLEGNSCSVHNAISMPKY